MSEQTQVVETEAQVQNPFSPESWNERAEGEERQEVVTEQVAAPTEKEVVETKVVEEAKPFIWKDKFGWENEEQAIAEVENLKKKADSPIEFANEDSRKFFEYAKEGKVDDLYSHLTRKIQLDKLASADATDLKQAEDIVKLSLKSKNIDLTDDDVDFLFRKKYSLPQKPEQGLESDDEYQKIVSNWEAQVEDRKRELVIEAKLAKPDLEKLRSELVLPDIQKGEDPKIAEARQQTELQQLTKLRESYLSTLESEYSKFNGFETKYKDEEVEIPVSFIMSEEEKVALKEELKDFPVDEFINSRWFNKDGSPNINQLMADVTLLRKKDDILQKVVNEVGANVSKHYRKVKSNINVTGSPHNTQTGSGQSDIDKQIEFIWNAK